MDISGRIRAVLAGVDLTGRERRVYAVMVAKVLRPGEKRLSICDSVEDGDDEDERQYIKRLAHQDFMEAGMMRVIGKCTCGKCGEGRFGTRLEGVRQQAEIWARGDLREPARLLWQHWLLTLGEHLGGPRNDRELMGRLWELGFVWQENKDAAPLHVMTTESLLDGFVYSELVALHAAYNSAKVAGDAAMMGRVRRVVRWHVENTQPDNTTNEPWGLAAFAALDETGTFAEQQLHDAVTHLRNSTPLPEGRVPAAVGLLADAVMTIEG